MSVWRHLAYEGDSLNTEVREPLVCTTELNCCIYNTNKMQKVMYVADFFHFEVFWPLLQLMNVDHGFLKADPNSWQRHSRYICAHSILCEEPTVNAVIDTSEHALGLLTAFNTGKVARGRKQQKYLRSIVSVLQQTLYETATSCERVTKQNRQSVRKHLDFFLRLERKRWERNTATFTNYAPNILLKL